MSPDRAVAEGEKQLLKAIMGIKFGNGVEIIGLNHSTPPEIGVTQIRA